MLAFIIALLIILLAEICIYLRSKTRKQGILPAIVLVFVCTLIGIVFLKSINVKLITLAFGIFYIVYAWIYQAVYMFVCHIGNGKRAKIYKSPVLYINILQTIIMLSHYLYRPIFTIRKHIAFGVNWWMAYGKHYKGSADLFTIFKMLFSASAVCILIVLVKSIKATPRIYRGRLIALIVMQLLYTIFMVQMNVREFPMILCSLIMCPLSAMGIYFAIYYADHKLQHNTLITFADDLSEGFILYNDLNELVHINGYMNRMLDSEILNGFKNIDQLKKWAGEVTLLNGVKARKIQFKGEDYYFDIRELPLYDNGTKTGTLFDLKDITNSAKEILLMEQINDELERTASMKADFLANMSHELRTPMNAVIGMAELTLREQLSPQVEDYVRQIKSSGTALLNIINDILDYSKIESGKMDIVTDEYEPAMLCQDIINTLQVRAESNGIELQCHYDAKIPSKLMGDADRIRQVLINIANNAVKFTKKGRVLICFGFEEKADDEIVLKVQCKDTGIGIKPENLERLFTSFTQLDSKRNRNVEGTGLGLAISKSLVEVMGGSIGVESEYGVGSNFYFSIPQKIVSKEAAIDFSGAAGKNVLCIVGNKEIETFLQQEFENIDMKCIFAKSVTDKLPECEYVITDEINYDSALEEYVTARPKLECGIIAPLASKLASSLQNVRIIKKPLSTIQLDRFFRKIELSDINEERKDEFRFDFTAPEAKVLLVDDNQVNLAVAAGLLEPLNMQVDTALSGGKAIELAAATKYDLIFMDHMMPDMDGVETTIYLRENEPNAKDIPIIALSANAVPEARTLFLNSGMNDFVAKPIELKTIVSKVKEWLSEDKIVEQEPVAVAASNAEEIVIDGIDTKTALEMLGSPALYKKILKDYFSSIDENYDELLQCYESKDFANYTIKIHALKSSSRQIGAMELAAMSEKLEFAGKADDIAYIDANYAEALSEYRRIQEILAPALKSMGLTGAAQEKIAFDKDKAEALLDELLEACDSFDMDECEDVLEGLKEMEVGENIAELLEQLGEAIDSIDTDECEEIATKLREAF